MDTATLPDAMSDNFFYSACWTTFWSPSRMCSLKAWIHFSASQSEIPFFSPSWILTEFTSWGGIFLPNTSSILWASSIKVLSDLLKSRIQGESTPVWMANCMRSSSIESASYVAEFPPMFLTLNSIIWTFNARLRNLFFSIVPSPRAIYTYCMHTWKHTKSHIFSLASSTIAAAGVQAYGLYPCCHPQ